MKQLLSIILVITGFALQAQKLYMKTFGNSKDKAIIFLHGGPGYNCASFESTTARDLADKGFFVIVYDRRGEGRSPDEHAKFTFEETFKDLNSLYKKYKLKKAILVGHSFGGIVATLYAEAFPERTEAVVLVSAPLRLQETFRTIIQTSRAIYQANKDSVDLKYISVLSKMDTTSLAYSSYCFTHAMKNKFYSPKHPTYEAKAVYASLKKDTVLSKYTSQMSFQAPQGFWANEKYTLIDLSGHLKNVISKGLPVYGIYGKDDGLYSPAQVAELQVICGNERFRYLEDCSHNVFSDQHTLFLDALTSWLK